MELGEKNGFGAEKNKKLSKSFCISQMELVASISILFFASISKWLIILTILRTGSCLWF